MQARQQNAPRSTVTGRPNSQLFSTNAAQRLSQLDVDGSLAGRMAQLGMDSNNQQQHNTRQFTGTSATDALRSGRSPEAYQTTFQDPNMTPQASFAAKGGPANQARFNDGARSRSPGVPTSSQGFTVDSAYLQRLQMQQAALIRQQQQLELQRAQQAEQQIQAQQQTVAIQMAMQALNQKVVQAQNIARINNWTLDEAIHQMGGFTQNELDLLKLAVVREQQAKELANLQVLQAQVSSFSLFNTHPLTRDARSIRDNNKCS
jgi:hypothetical protein